MPTAHFPLQIYVHLTLFFLVTQALASNNLAPTTLITTRNPLPELLFHVRAIPNCPVSAIPCGATCIPSDYTCCPDHGGGCSAKEVCQIGDNGVYGCCAVGDVCVGDGGSQFIDEKIGGDDSGNGGGDQNGNGDGGGSPLGSKGAGRRVSVGGGMVVVVGAAMLGCL